MAIRLPAQATVVVSRQAVYAATTVSTGFDGGSGALIAAGIAGLLVIAGFALKSGEFGSRKKKSELEKKIDFVKKTIWPPNVMPTEQIPREGGVFVRFYRLVRARCEIND